MPYSNYLDSGINKLYFGSTAFASPGTVYVGLSTTTPAADGTGVTEPVGNAYARVSVANDTTHFHAAPSQPGTGQRQSNLLAISFAQATGDWGTCTYWVMYDAAAAGNLLAFGLLTTAQHPINGDTPNFAIDQLTVTEQ